MVPFQDTYQPQKTPRAHEQAVSPFLPEPSNPRRRVSVDLSVLDMPHKWSGTARAFCVWSLVFSVMLFRVHPRRSVSPCSLFYG